MIKEGVPLLDLDQLKTLVAIADSGSFTKAAIRVHKTQSAVSMQMRRLEESIGRTLFCREGRQSRLTEDGERLVHYARRLVNLHDETLAKFASQEVSGRVHLGTPDDYADRFLPQILAGFASAYPGVEVSVTCAPTPNLREALAQNELDIAIVTHVPMKSKPTDEIIRSEPLLWVASERHYAEQSDVLPLALGRITCDWRKAALTALDSQNKDYRVLYTSWNSTAVGAAVLAGLALSVLPESAIRKGMRILGPEEGFPKLPVCNIAVVRAESGQNKVAGVLAQHIIASLGNLEHMKLSA